jgi:2-polyprenyl-6-methoxyphenol hydroxylase-like FAD-dependent oxidoreductase
MVVMDRQQMLQIMHGALTDKNKARVVMGARLEAVEEVEGGVRVRAADGRSWTGDILVGADGVHSAVRREMQRLGSAENPKLFERDGPDRLMTCAWRTTFGIAELPPGERLPAGSVHVTHGHAKSCGVMSVGDGRTYFMLNEALPQGEVQGEAAIPTYGEADMLDMVRARWNEGLQPCLTVGKLFSHRLRATLVSMAEYVLGRWYHGRVICLGDSAHKVSLRGC